jgi:putative transcriptional regulator
MARKPQRTIKAKSHDEIFGDMVEGLTEAIGIARGEADPSTYRVHVPKDVDVKTIRAKTGLSQEAFARAYGFSTGSVRDWEQRRVMPDQGVRAYLYVIGRKPDMVKEMLAPIYETAKSITQHAISATKAAAVGKARKATTSRKQKRSSAFASERRGDHHANR